jgi:hypothetical protein
LILFYLFVLRSFARINDALAKKSIKSKGFALSNGVIVKSKCPIKILNNAQSTYNVGEESSFLIVLAKGNENLTTEMPRRKCGTGLVKINPEKNGVE